MPNLQTRKVGGIFRGLFAGHSGVGKTIAAGSFPGPMIIYDFDGRVDSLLNFYPLRDDIEYKTVVSGKSARRDTISFLEFCQEFMDLQERCDWETVVIDSITQLSACCFMHILESNGEFTLFGRGKKLPKVELRDYQQETSTVLKILEVIKSLPCHTIATAHPVAKLKTETPGDLESLEPVQSLTGYGQKTPSFVPNYFNEMYWFYNQQVSQMGQKAKRFICTEASGDIPAKTALPGWGPIVEVTNKPLYNLIQTHLADYNVRLEAARVKEVVGGQ